MDFAVRVAVIVVNYGTADLTVAAVNSVISRDHDGISVSVHVVDNASPGDDGERLKALQSDQVTVYAEAVNHGFGRANNLVIDRLLAEDTPPDYVFLLNPDARLKNDAIVKMATFLEEHPKAAIGGAKILKPGLGARVAAFRFPTFGTELAAAIAFRPISRLISRRTIALSPDLSTQEVDWVAGAAMMVRVTALEEVGGFDPVFFLYYEEVELMRRVKASGHQVWYLADAEVEHEEGAATQVESAQAERRRKPSYWYFSWQHYFLTTHGRVYALLTAFAVMIGRSLNFLISGMRGKQPSAPIGFYGDFWAMAIRPLLGMREQPYD